MQSTSQNPEELGGEEYVGLRRGSTHAVWTQRRQTKQRSRVRAKRRSGMASVSGMHMRRNKRSSW